MMKAILIFRGIGQYIAIPQGGIAKVHVTSQRTEVFTNIHIAPAPRIPLDTDDGPLFYEKNERIYSKNAYYPVEPVKLSEQTTMRGVDVCIFRNYSLSIQSGNKRIDRISRHGNYN